MIRTHLIHSSTAVLAGFSALVIGDPQAYGSVASSSITTALLLALAQAPICDYVFAWDAGSVGTDDGQFGEDLGPRGLEVVDTVIYVCDYGNRRLQWFDTATGTFLGTKDLYPLYPVDIEHELESGRFYVRSTNHVVALDGSFNELWTVTIPTEFDVCYGLGVDSTGNIHTPSSYYDDVYIVSPDGLIIGQYSAPESDTGIEAIDGYIYIACGINGVHKFTESGEPLGQVVDGSNIPFYISSLPDGRRVLASGGPPNLITVYDSAWIPMCTFGGTGTEDGQFAVSVMGVTSDEVGNIYASDGSQPAKSRRIQKFVEVVEQPELVSAVSCVTHAGDGEMCLELALEGPTTTEPRLDGGSKIKLMFSAPIGMDADEACSNILIKGCSGIVIEPDRLGCSFDESETMLTVEFPGLNPPQLDSGDCYVLDLTGLGLAGDAIFVIRILEGDANGDTFVDPLDDGFVKARFGCTVVPPDPNCFLADINNDGKVDPLDSGAVLARLGDEVCQCE